MLLDTNAIQKILPHRYPFLLVDAIEEMEPRKRIVGIKNVTINESYFQGHFPGQPVMPGVLIIESMAQTGGVLLLKEVPDREKKLHLFRGDRQRALPPAGGSRRPVELEMNVVACRGTFLQARRPRHGERRTGRRSHDDVQDGGPRSRSSRLPAEARRRRRDERNRSPGRRFALGEAGKGRSQSAPTPSSATKSSWAMAAFSSITPSCRVPPRSAATITSIPSAIVGGDPQDLTYTGQRVTLEVGDANEFREFCTVNRGTVKGGGVTRVGSHNLIMSYAHIGARLRHRRPHDSHQRRAARRPHHRRRLRRRSARSACCTSSPASARHSYIGAGTVITQDVPPFSMVVAPRETRCFGINTSASSATAFRPSASRPSSRPTGCCFARS